MTPHTIERSFFSGVSIFLSETKRISSERNYNGFLFWKPNFLPFQSKWLSTNIAITGYDVHDLLIQSHIPDSKKALSLNRKKVNCSIDVPNKELASEIEEQDVLNRTTSNEVNNERRCVKRQKFLVNVTRMQLKRTKWSRNFDSGNDAGARGTHAYAAFSSQIWMSSQFTSNI